MYSWIHKILLALHLHPFGKKNLILIPQCSDNKFEYAKRWTFDSGWEYKGVWSIITEIHKGWGKSTDALNIERVKIHMKHEPRGIFWDTNSCNSCNFSYLVQETNRSEFFQVRDIFWWTFHKSFSCHLFQSGNRDMTKTLMNNLKEFYFFFFIGKMGGTKIFLLLWGLTLTTYIWI